MVASLLITVREGLEASLIIGILLAFLARSGKRSEFRSIWLGVAAAAFASLLTAGLVLFTLGELRGAGEELFEGAVMWVAAGVLTYMIFWMRRQSRYIKAELQARAEAALLRGSSLGLASLAFIAVFREGGETVLFLAALSRSASPSSIGAGSALGVTLAVLVGYLVYRGGRRINTRVFFEVTGGVLLLFAAGLVGQATLAFQAAGLFPGTISAWDMGALLSDQGVLGSLLQALFGYTATPSVLQVIFYLSYLAVVGYLLLDGREHVDGRYVDPFRAWGSDYTAWLYRLLRRPLLPEVVSALAGLVLVGLIAVALFGVSVGPFDNRGFLNLGPFASRENGDNLFNLVMWVIWLPLLSLSALVGGRLWCGNLCPVRLLSEKARDLADWVGGKGSASGPYMRAGWILPTTFVLVTLVVKLWPVQREALYGAYFFIAVMALALLVSLLFRRGTWCRYVCPIGGWLARIARLSVVSLRPNTQVCAECTTRECIKGSEAAGRCPAFLNPSQIESNRYCLTCWNCIKNCPAERASLKLGYRVPGAELRKPYAPDLWECLFVSGLLGMYVAVARQGILFPELPWPAVFFGIIGLFMVAYVGLSSLAAFLAGISLREAVTNFGYIFLPLEFGFALVTFGDDALEFFNLVVPGAILLVGGGFLWSLLLLVSISRNHSKGGNRSLLAAMPIGAALVFLLFLWMSWYASGIVIDLT